MYNSYDGWNFCVLFVLCASVCASKHTRARVCDGMFCRSNATVITTSFQVEQYDSKLYQIPSLNCEQQQKKRNTHDVIQFSLG